MLLAGELGLLLHCVNLPDPKKHEPRIGAV